MRFLGLVLFGAAAIWAQGGSMAFTPPASKPPAVKGAPYSGEEEFVRGEKVEKGRRIFRDSEGRVRTERPMYPGGNTTSSKSSTRCSAGSGCSTLSTRSHT